MEESAARGRGNRGRGRGSNRGRRNNNQSKTKNAAAFEVPLEDDLNNSYEGHKNVAAAAQPQSPNDVLNALRSMGITVTVKNDAAGDSVHGNVVRPRVVNSTDEIVTEPTEAVKSPFLPPLQSHMPNAHSHANHGIPVAQWGVQAPVNVPHYPAGAMHGQSPLMQPAFSANDVHADNFMAKHHEGNATMHTDNHQHHQFHTQFRDPSLNFGVLPVGMQGNHHFGPLGNPQVNQFRPLIHSGMHSNSPPHVFNHAVAPDVMRDHSHKALMIPLPTRPAVNTRPDQPKPLPKDTYLQEDFTQEIMELLGDISPPESDKMRHLSSIHYLSIVVQKLFGNGARVLPYGSVASGMWLKGSGDVDLCIMLDSYSESNAEIQRAKEEVRLKEEHELAEDLRHEEWKQKKIDLEKESGQEVELTDHEVESEPETEEAKETEQATKIDDQPKDKKNKKKRLRKFKRREFREYTLAQYLLESFGKELENHPRFTEIKILTKTRVPIVKMRDSETSLNIDIGYNNFLGVVNTRLLLTYSLIDPRFKQMVLLVKCWAKRRTINDTYSGTLSSYGYVLMVIHFLQYACFPPVLPNLQNIEPMKRPYKHGDKEYDVYFFDDIDRLKANWRIENVQTVGELMYEFYYYWGHVFDYKVQVASIRTGGVLTKEEKGWVPLLEQEKKSKENEPSAAERKDSSESLEIMENAKLAKQDVKKEIVQRYWICIEDPFEITHNLGRPVGRDSLYFIRGEFLQAFSAFGNCKFYTFEYLKSNRVPVYGRLKPNELGQQTVLQKILEESQYKTREEHKQRNKENKEWSDKRKKSIQPVNK
ncbi:hypothetical protein MP638_004623 [Amoeboaphelidium occidentale]|nr:hypothetical protein MP638_004623 [Amoeboaphelidium occidentale]